MTVTVHLITGEHIPCRNIESFHLHTDRFVLRGTKNRYEFQRRKMIGFDVAFMPYTNTNVGVKRG